MEPLANPNSFANDPPFKEDYFQFPNNNYMDMTTNSDPSPASGSLMGNHSPVFAASETYPGSNQRVSYSGHGKSSTRISWDLDLISKKLF